MSEQQFGRAWEIFMEVTHRKTPLDEMPQSKRRKKPPKSSIQLNEVFSVLIELGITTWLKLPAEMRRGLFKRQKFVRREKFRVDLEDRVARLSERFKLNDRLALAVPSTVKTTLRLEKQRTGVSMSAQVRQKLVTEAA